MATEPIELPLVEDWTLYAGSTFRRAWRWLRDGQPLDLSGWRGACQVRATASASSPAQLDLTTDNGGVTLTADGLVIVYATDEQTGAIVLPPSGGRYDVELENVAGERFRFAMGAVELDPEVTR